MTKNEALNCHNFSPLMTFDFGNDIGVDPNLT